MNLCINCQHHEAVRVAGPQTSFAHIDHMCHALDGQVEQPVVGGALLGVECGLMRLGSACGLGSALFLPLAPPAPEVPVEPETDDHYRERLLLAIGPTSVNTEKAKTATGDWLDQLGTFYDLPRRR